MLLMLVNRVTPRLLYTVDLMLGRMLGLEVEFTTSREEFASFTGPRLCYHPEFSPGCLTVFPDSLLFDEGLRLEPPGTGRFLQIPVLFPNEIKEAGLPFDPFAAGFYMSSRYEEYLPHDRDRYGRYKVADSIAWKENFLLMPVVHLWAGMIEEALTRLYPGLAIKRPSYRYIPTFDVDHAYCYLGRPFLRTLGGIGRSALHGRLHEIGRRISVLGRRSHDPYDTYDYIRKVLDGHCLTANYFILFADYGGDDNNVSTSSKLFAGLIRSLDRDKTVGVHPSLSSNKHFDKLRSECDGLSDILDRDITMSRQHFLKISLPRTYRALTQVGIRHDFSMGYASQAGFRSGVAIPYPFYDLLREESTRLTIHPTIIMDVTLRDYLRLTPDKSLELAAGLIRATRSVNGELVTLWHNENLSEAGRWLGWRSVFEEMVRIAAS